MIEKMPCGHPVECLSDPAPDFIGDKQPSVGTVYCMWCADLAMSTADDTLLGIIADSGIVVTGDIDADLNTMSDMCFALVDLYIKGGKRMPFDKEFLYDNPQLSSLALKLEELCLKAITEKGINAY